MPYRVGAAQDRPPTSTVRPVPVPAEVPTVVIGAGPAGLATAAALTRAGRPVAVLERADQVGAAWAARYDSLHLHTVRWLSGLPGSRSPAATAAGWPATTSSTTSATTPATMLAISDTGMGMDIDTQLHIFFRALLYDQGRW